MGHQFYTYISILLLAVLLFELNDFKNAMGHQCNPYGFFFNNKRRF